MNAEIFSVVKSLPTSEKNKAFHYTHFCEKSNMECANYILGAGTREDTEGKIACRFRYY
jgi:hypothetical protein